MIEYNGQTVLCIWEGTFEKELIELLLEKNLLFFKTKDLVEEKVTTTRILDKIKSQYLSHSYKNGLIIVRVLDSEQEGFNLGKAYERKVKKLLQ